MEYKVSDLIREEWDMLTDIIIYNKDDKNLIYINTDILTYEYSQYVIGIDILDDTNFIMLHTNTTILSIKLLDF